MRIIRVFCDDNSVWLDKNLNQLHTQRDFTTNGEPYIKVEFLGILWEFYIYGMNNTDMLPTSIKMASSEGCRPDIWFYDSINDNILLAIEETATAPVGNAQKQRIPRPMWAIENNVPFIFISPKDGMDNSQGKKRKITGPFLNLVDNNPQSFFTKDKYNIIKIMEEISKGDVKKYLIKSPLNLIKLGKSKVSVKGNKNLNKIKEIIDSDVEVYNVIETTGNIYVIPKNSKTAKHFGYKVDTILIIGKGWKSSNVSGYSDPLAGGIMMVYYINKWYGNSFNISCLSTHDCFKYNTSKLISANNKMTSALSKVDSLIDLCGNKFKVNYTPNEIFEFSGLDESIATYCRAKDLIEDNVVLDFVQGPHGSWASKDGLNTQKRDVKRPDIYYDEFKKSEEGKTKLSDVYKHIEKYGLIHDKYYYLIQDCPIKVENSDKIIKVSFL